MTSSNPAPEYQCSYCKKTKPVTELKRARSGLICLSCIDMHVRLANLPEVIAQRKKERMNRVVVIVIWLTIGGLLARRPRC
jgi:recombinational DNA repair protein (RecF pathway)